MSSKQYVPEIEEEWDEYWKKTSIEKELELTNTDGLLPIFHKYLPKNRKILEAGCGMGKWVIRLTNEGYDITGVDTNEFALQKLKLYQPNAKIRKADVTKLPYDDFTFNAYLSLGVVEHFEEGPLKALKEAYRVIDKDGLAIVEVPFDSPLRKLTRLINTMKRMIKTPARLFVETTKIRKPRQLPTMKFYEYRYTVKELKSFMKQVGFNKIKVLPKDDLSNKRSIALWLDYQLFQKKDGNYFELNILGMIAKALLNALSPFTYSALIVAIARKK